MQYKRHKPTLEEKLKLPGNNNVETLLLVISARLTEKVPVVLLGRASYEVDDPALSKNLIEELKEKQKMHETRNIHIITEDIDGFATDATEIITAMAHRGSYVAELCDTYFHPLGNETLFLPEKWEERLEDVKIKNCHNLEIKRLHPLDFILCKGAAGRAKDEIFLKPCMKIKKISKEDIKKHWEKTNCQKLKKIIDHPSTMECFKRTLGFKPTDPEININ